MKSLIITTVLIAFSIINAFSQDISGVWHGIAKSPDDKEILFVFLLENTPNGPISTMAVPTFDVSDIKPQATTFDNGLLRIDGSNVGMTYEGQFNETTQQIEGSYTEGGAVLSLILTKGNPKIAALTRPQMPIKPYSYVEEEVVFENTEADIVLAGTFTRPEGNEQFPVVILISGSGRHDRDGSIPTHKPFLVLADNLTRKGIAVLRFDDRGFGESTGDYSKATTADFATDVLSAVRYLTSRTDIDTTKIGLIGHSEGGIIAPLAANQTTDVSFIVVLAATGIPGSEVSVMQSKTIRPFPVPDEAAFEQNLRKAFDIIASDQDISEKREELIAHNNSYLVPILTSLGATDDNISAFIRNETENSLTPWTRYFITYNPADEFEKLRIPVLSLTGSKDTQVDATVNQAAIRNALSRGDNMNYKIVELETLNHLFQECETGNIDEYKDIEQTMSPIAIEEISTWILKITQMD